MNSSIHALYIHWPFCPYKCHFCPFVALASHDEFMKVYHDALSAEIEKYGAKQKISTIFMGGGTPSTYPEDLLLDMAGTLSNVFAFQKGYEFTIEVNPGTVRGLEHLRAWQKAGINRLSIGVQSLNDSVLTGLNRHQKKEDVFTLLNWSAQVFENISIDLILGLPGISRTEWMEELRTVASWQIKHISVYFLTVHEHTPLFYKVKKQEIALAEDEDMVQQYFWTREFLLEHGFEQYELSNFAKPGYQSAHNKVYWDRKPYKGFGLGACSFDGKQRTQNEKNLIKYLQSDANKKITFVEELTPEQKYLEQLMLGLRRVEGISQTILLGEKSVEEQKRISLLLHSYQKKGLLERKNNNWRLTPAGMVVENKIITHIVQ